PGRAGPRALSSIAPSAPSRGGRSPSSTTATPWSAAEGSSRRFAKVTSSPDRRYLPRREAPRLALRARPRRRPRRRGGAGVLARRGHGLGDRRPQRPRLLVGQLRPQAGLLR